MARSARKYPHSANAPKRTRKTLSVAFKDKHGFWPDDEACTCGRAQKLHGPDGFTHEFVPTGRKAFGA